MYNVKGPSKIVAKTTRRGLTQNIETFRDHSRNKNSECEDQELINGPKPVFQNVTKKLNQQRTQECITPQHEEIIKYVNESWNSIYSEIKHAADSPYCREVFSEDVCMYMAVAGIRQFIASPRIKQIKNESEIISETYALGSMASSAFSRLRPLTVYIVVLLLCISFNKT